MSAGRVLLIDDDKFVRDRLRSEFHSAGLDVHAFSFGEEGLDWITQNHCDVIVIDPTSPTSDGLVLVQQLVDSASHAEVIAILSPNHIEMLEGLLTLGVRSVLYKPLALANVAHAVSRALIYRSTLKGSSFERADAVIEVVRRIAFSAGELGFHQTTLGVLRNWSGAKAGLFWTRAGVGQRSFLASDFGLSERKKEKLSTRFEAWLEQGGRSPEPRVVIDRADRKEEGVKLPRGYTHGLFVPLRWTGGNEGTIWLLADQKVGWNIAWLHELHTVQVVVQSALERVGDQISQMESERWDELTRLYGVAGLRRALEDMLLRGDEIGPLAILAIDVDHFKRINDNYGHSVGGQCLVEVAHLLKGCIRAVDTVSRPRADEFLVLLPGVDGAVGEPIAERIRHEIEHHRFLAREGLHVQLTATVAVLDVPPTLARFSDFVRTTDQIVQIAKQSGRNRVVGAAETRELVARYGQDF
ncbi:MAG: GGDEF domain-containing response regulator [Myxococcales bacterium]|nr:GGDEF domain-containing response regulator [Myxococcales bacterium]